MAKSQAEILKNFGRSGWTVTATRPETVTVLTENPANPAEKIPVEQPTGNTVWGITSPTTGQYDEVVVKPILPGPLAPDQVEAETTYEPVKGPKEEVKTPTGESTEAGSPQLAAQRAAEAEAARALAAQRAAETAQRQKNKEDHGYAVTDAEWATLERQKGDQNLTQQQVDLRAHELEQSSAARGRELDIAAANNQIAAANQALAQKRLELDQIVRDDASKLDWAKFEYLKAKDGSDNQIAQARLDLERLAQQQTAANQTVANTIAQQTLEQRKVEQVQAADIAAQTAAVGATTGQLNAIAQGATAGAGLLQNRVTNAQNLVQQGMGLLGQTKHGLLVSPGADFGQNLVQGAAGFATELGGGTEVYQAAANLVRRADPNGAQGQDAAAAYAFLTQMFQKYRQTHGGQPAPEEVQALKAGPPAAGTVQQTFVAPPQPFVQSGLPEGRSVAPPQALPQAFAQSGLPEGRGVGVSPSATVPMPPMPTFVAPQQQVAAMSPITPQQRNITITVPTG